MAVIQKNNRKPNHYFEFIPSEWKNVVVALLPTPQTLSDLKSERSRM